jgi:hypothetical protein
VKLRSITGRSLGAPRAAAQPGEVEFAAVLLWAGLPGAQVWPGLLLIRQLLKATFGQDVRRYQEHIPGRRYNAAYPKRQATRGHLEFPREFLFAAHNFGGARERPCINRWHCF